jgi:hypothetical protein
MASDSAMKEFFLNSLTKGALKLFISKRKFQPCRGEILVTRGVSPGITEHYDQAALRLKNFSSMMAGDSAMEESLFERHKKPKPRKIRGFDEKKELKNRSVRNKNTGSTA